MLRPLRDAQLCKEFDDAWISVAPQSPYFVDRLGKPWTPIGQNDAITWPELSGLYKARNSAEAEAYLRMLAKSGVTCLRLMLEYSQSAYRYLERKDGSFNPVLVRMWDDIFDLCRRYGIKVLVTPFDTFWMWKKWKLHPYNTCNGGPCDSRSKWLTCTEMRSRIKRRLEFATERWGWDGTVFAWDLWNEIHPAHAGDAADVFWEFVEDVSTHLRETELRLHGASHLQTVSVFLPIVKPDSQLAATVFSHPCLDMVNVHMYEHGTIDDPRNTIDAAVATGRLIANAVTQAVPNRPVFDSEHGPIHTFKDRRKTLPDDFDDEYFRHMQWAHLATGGAGGGMRWPNRHPHSLTAGMREAQRVMADFLPYIDWPRFQRRTLTGALKVGPRRVESFGCSDAQQAILYFIRRDSLDSRGMVNTRAEPVRVTVDIPNMQSGHYRITAWSTRGGLIEQWDTPHFTHGSMSLVTPPVVDDVALAVTRRHS